LSGVLVLTVTTELGARTGSGRKRIASARLKIALLAPIPRARERAAMNAKPGFLTRMRIA
jgi:hypothetical protein